MQQHSEAGQDVFAYKLLHEGQPIAQRSFLDIGSGYPVYRNNSYALECLGWSGVLVDIGDHKEACARERRSPFVQADVKDPGWWPLVKAAGLPLPIVDFLSFDLDDDTIEIIDAFPFAEVQFRVITIEHDKYRLGPQAQVKIRTVLESYGYEVICTDVSCDAGPFEDWYVHPDLVDIELARSMRCNGVHGDVLAAHLKALPAPA